MTPSKPDDLEPLLRRLERRLSVRRVFDALRDRWTHRGEGFALRRWMAALAHGRGTLDSSDATGLLTLEAYAAWLAGRGRWREALAVIGSVADAFEQALGPQDPSTLRASARRAQLLWRLDEGEAASTLAAHVVEATRRLGDEVAFRGASAGLALILADRGRLAEARALQERVVAGRTADDGEAHPAVLPALVDLFMTQVEMGDVAVAEETLGRIQAVRIATFPIRHRIAFDRVSDVMEANLRDFREQQALQAVLASRHVPPRRTWPREPFAW